MQRNAQPKMPLLLWPGLAADARLFAPLLERVQSASVPRFIDPFPKESLRAYAARYAEVIEQDLPSDGEYAVGGFSFGGQLAMELAAVLEPRPLGIVLICGVRGTNQILPGFVRQQRIGALIPGAIARRIYGPFARRFARQERLDADAIRLLVAMARDNDPKFLNWSSRACARWEGPPELDMPVRHIHGGLDRIIPDVDRKADETIEGARHLISLTHAEDVSEFTLDALDSFSRSDTAAL